MVARRVCADDASMREPFRSSFRPRSRRQTPLRPFAFSVILASAGVALLYLFLLPRFSALPNGAALPALTQLAVQSGMYWAIAAIAISLFSAWLLRNGARDRAQLLGRFLLHFLLLLNVLMVGLMAAGIYSAIAALPGQVAG